MSRQLEVAVDSINDSKKVCVRDKSTQLLIVCAFHDHYCRIHCAAAKIDDKRLMCNRMDAVIGDIN